MALDYETSLWKEIRRPVGTGLAAMIGLGVFVVVAELALLAVLFLLHRLRPGFCAVVGAVMVPAALGIATGISARSVVLVFSDRIEIYVRVCGVTIWKRIVRWAELARCDLYKNWQAVSAETPRLEIRAVRRFHVLSRTIGWTIVMCGGDGVALLLHGEKGLLLGSDDPEGLCEMVNRARGS